MSRPPVSVVMPFAGDEAAARAASAALRSLQTMPGDELILADNSGVAQADAEVAVITVTGEHSPASARNAGVAHARNDWILFVDADCRPSGRLLEDYFAAEVPESVGALVGEVVPATDSTTVAARYAAHRNFLSQQSHLQHRFRPRATAANLLVRRAAFEQVGGFYEGVRAAEDTDFSWRLQDAGWRLELRPQATVQHVYRTTVADLRRQWRGYAAGRAWLARRYEAFRPQPAVRRALARRLRGVRRDSEVAEDQPGAVERARFAALDALLGFDELAGLVLSNRPERAPRAAARVVLLAERFPARDDPLVDFARTIDAARVEAAARPALLDLDAARQLDIGYREDDGIAARALALVRLIARHPIRCVIDVAGGGPGEPTLASLAPAVLRLARDENPRLHPLGGEEVQRTARRLAALAGRPLDR